MSISPLDRPTAHTLTRKAAEVDADWDETFVRRLLARQAATAYGIGLENEDVETLAVRLVEDIEELVTDSDDLDAFRHAIEYNGEDTEVAGRLVPIYTADIWAAASGFCANGWEPDIRSEAEDLQSQVTSAVSEALYYLATNVARDLLAAWAEWDGEEEERTTALLTPAEAETFEAFRSDGMSRTQAFYSARFALQAA